MNAATPTGFASNWEIMGALLRKDWRVYRLPAAGLLLLTATCYLLAATDACYNHSDIRSEHHENEAEFIFFSAALIANYLVPLLAAVFGGVAIAGERSERTSDFLAMLPVSRWQIVMSKWIVSLFILTGFVVLNLLVMLCVILMTETVHEFFAHAADADYAIALWVALAISFYGIAWLVSTFTRSAPISACVSIAVTVILAIAVTVFVDTQVDIGWFKTHENVTIFVMGLNSHLHASLNKSQFSLLAISTSAMLLGCTSVVSGTFYYLRRIAP
jgi:hypothetical protein